MFGRRKTAEPPPAEAVSLIKPVGKGRATPKRSQAQAGNRTPLVGGGKAVSARSKEDRRAAFQQTLEAHRTEDQRHLPARDRGPVRKFVRDIVDGRRNIGEYFLPIALVVLLLSALPYPILQIGSAVGLYLILGVLIMDSLLLGRSTKAKVRERFGEDSATERGLGTYAVMRGFQMRRMRRPHPQVRHGQPPR
mgnify:CR=1 FL=1